MESSRKYDDGNEGENAEEQPSTYSIGDWEEVKPIELPGQPIHLQQAHRIEARRKLYEQVLCTLQL